MKKYIAIITDREIRSRFDEATAELERDNQIRFPDSKTRTAFIDDCVSSEIDKYELYDSNPFSQQTNYAVLVLDMAELYGCQL